MNELMPKMSELLAVPGLEAGLILALTVVAAIIVRMVFSRFIMVFVRRTRTTTDDRIVEASRGPAISLILLAGAGWALTRLNLTDRLESVVLSVLVTLGVVLVGVAAVSVAMVVFDSLSHQMDRAGLVQPRTLPLLQITTKILVFGACAYFVFVSWGIDLTTWLASAGIIGIAVGFAAKDTLANLFAGIFILVDAPYKIGDFIVLDDGVRGEVVEIGIRSTRLLTRDDVEITVPNAVIGGAKIVNQTSGRHEKMRVRVTVSVAYGSDIDEVRQILMACAQGVKYVDVDPEPRVRFREFGDSGLNFELQVWIDQPVFRGHVIDELNTRIYKAFNAENIEIPYPKRDVYIKEQPPGREGSGGPPLASDS